MTSKTSSTAMPVNTQRSLPMALLRAREAVMERFRPMLAGHGMTEQQWRVLRVLGEASRMEAGQVAERASVLPPSLSRIIRALEKSGHLKSSRDKSDGRRAMLSLTARGRALLEHGAPESAAAYAAIEKAFGEGEVARLVDMLEALQSALKKA